MDSGWLQRKAPTLRGAREQPTQEANADEAPTAAARPHEPEEQHDGEDDDAPLATRRRNRLRMSSDSSDTSDEEVDDENDGALARLLRDDDSLEGESDNDDEADNALRDELGLDDDDGLHALARHHPGLYLFQQRFPPRRVRRNEIALHLTDDDGVGRADGSVVDLENTQENEAQEIDLTTLSSDSEDERRGARNERGNENDIDDDDEVQIVGSTAPPGGATLIGSVRLVPGRNRKRRRVDDGPTDAAPRAFDTQRAESTNISLENNETIERFKAALKCSVCLEVIEDMTSTICGHVYCAKCIRLAIRVTHKCPLCQRPLRPTDIHGLFF